MHPASIPTAAPHAAIVETLAHRLEMSERGHLALDAQRYRALVARLSLALRDTPADVDLDPLLKAYPAAAELYENLNYQVAGLCRSPLEASLHAELLARVALSRAGSETSGTR